MTIAMPTNQELQVLEALRAHRRKHRAGLPLQSSAHIEHHRIINYRAKNIRCGSKDRGILEVHHYPKCMYLYLDCL